MANLERDTYEPTNIHPFDSGEDVESFDEGSRLPLLIVIALIVLAAFAGVVWLAYTQGVERGRADVPRVAAAEPSKAAPQTPSSPPYTGLKIYQQPAAAAGDTGSPDTVPPPPTPLAAARAPNAPPPLRPFAAAETPSSTSTQAIPSVVPPKPAVPPQAASQRIATQAPAAITTQSPAPAAVRIPSAAAATTAGPTGIFLQIGSFKSPAEARQSWTAFKARHEIAAGYQTDIREVDLGAKGTWYRLRLGGFADKQAAAAFCEKLRSDGASCLLAK
ncbi:MAG: SPOR domain-containing protein [Rhizomicrobium sp.]